MTDLNRALGDPAKRGEVPPFDKALAAAKMRQSDEEIAFRRAVTAGKAAQSLLLHEQAMLETFPVEQRGAVMAFVRWSQGQKFEGGLKVKLAAKMAFIQAFQIAEAVYEVGSFAPKKENPNER